MKGLNPKLRSAQPGFYSSRYGYYTSVLQSGTNLRDKLRTCLTFTKTKMDLHRNTLSINRQDLVLNTKVLTKVISIYGETLGLSIIYYLSQEEIARDEVLSNTFHIILVPFPRPTTY